MTGRHEREERHECVDAQIALQALKSSMRRPLSTVILRLCQGYGLRGRRIPIDAVRCLLTTSAITAPQNQSLLPKTPFFPYSES
jgi:hypothetical protein